MFRFCGLYVSDHRHRLCAMQELCPSHFSENPRFVGHLGLGYYNGDEVLLMRRPVSSRTRILDLVGPAVGNQILFGLEDSPDNRFRVEATPPYRFRSFLGLWTVGPIRDGGFRGRLTEVVPEYLMANIKTEAPAELLFHLFLSYVHDMGRIGGRKVTADTLLEAMRSTFLLFPKLLEAGSPVPWMAACVSDGRQMVAACQGTDLWVRESTGIRDCPCCSETLGNQVKSASHPDVRIVAFAHGGMEEGKPGFARVPDRQVLVSTDSGELKGRGL